MCIRQGKPGRDQLSTKRDLTRSRQFPPQKASLDGAPGISLHEVGTSIHNRSVEGATDAVTIRRATLADLPMLLRYRRAMAEETHQPDPVAVHRMITALEPYLRTAIPEGRWHAWIAEPGGCGSVELVPWAPGRHNPSPRRAWIRSVPTERRLAASLCIRPDLVLFLELCCPSFAA